ncbi:cbb3-type cytochrome oxidase assembly protein CcoS [Rhodopirellula halodulae]|uniref:cbb3-type cytochrome oxidase assembly protein CcoS n=1 Tax=Rhodopirellula halodulae TaxID=2894198 RepID=UPI001E4AF4E7|nr:cbb3-type cytochrome oxidase assembly protein CcoS [Rhodopirellula sp. JC737]MCC9657891.1 cbb3-type cytochrome oxidase assembly protein CcoS [Rhodopirellula sp. JC737]
MSVLFIALPLALLLGAGGLIACVMCIRGGQYEDLETPAVRMLIDDDPRPPSTTDDRTTTENTQASQSRND